MRTWRIVPAAVLALGLVVSGLQAAEAAPTPPPTPSPTPTATPTAPPPTGKRLALTLRDQVLTLPAGDGVNDRTTARVVSGAPGRVDLIARGEKEVVVLATDVALHRARSMWTRTVAVDVSQLPKGSWTLSVRRTTGRAMRASAPSPLRVGSGKPVSVAVIPDAGTLYPYKDGSLDRLMATVDVRDETGTSLPVRGSSVLTVAKKVRSAKLHAATALTASGTIAGLARTGISVTGLPFGTADLTTTLRAPAGKAKVVHTAVTLAPTGVDTLRIARSSDTVQPVLDGLLDTVVLTPSAVASGGAPVPISGTLALTLGKYAITTWPVSSTTAPITWDGRVGGKVLPGVYTATLTLRGPEGLPRTTSTTITVSAAHLPWRVRDLITTSAGNQQGLAVHDGIFFVGYDNGDGTARIEQYSASGQSLPSGLQQLPIGHAAELGFSTTTGRLYAANGGPTDGVAVWRIDPGVSGAAAIEAKYDLSSLGVNGMVAVDDTNSRLLVFAGDKVKGFTLSSVSLLDVTDPNTASTVPAGSILSTTPIVITGTPQGIDLVNGQLWVYTSFKKANHLAKYDIAGNPTIADGFDLMNPGEGEGMAVDLPTGTIYVGAHSANRIGVLEAVADEEAA